MKTLVIGWGNTLRGDDGVGPYVADRLRAALPSPDIEILVCHQLTPELALPISQCGRVVFIDAHCGLPGGQYCIQPVQIDEAGLAASGTHACSPAALLVMAGRLFGHQPAQALVVKLGVENLELHEGLSPSVLDAAQRATDELTALLAPTAPPTLDGAYSS